jgi:hypothetical protein
VAWKPNTGAVRWEEGNLQQEKKRKEYEKIVLTAYNIEGNYIFRAQHLVCFPNDEFLVSPTGLFF